MQETPDTVTEAVELLTAAGYVDEFGLGLEHIRCPSCEHEHDPEQLVVQHAFRFEGASDPGDEAIVLGLQCPVCGLKGILVSAFGPDASPALLAVRHTPEA